jgi:hypothetical protein
MVAAEGNSANGYQRWRNRRREPLGPGMQTIANARQRLDRALARLEAAERRRMMGRARARASGPDWDALVQSLDAAQKENQALLTRNQALAKRVDALIARLESELDGAAER